MEIWQKDLLRLEENGRSIHFREIVFSKILEMIFLYLMGIINSVLLSGYSPEAVSIANISSQIFNLVIILPSMAVSGAAICINVALGQMDKDVAAEVAGTCMWLAIAIAVITGGIVFVFAENILGTMNVEPYMMDAAVSYMRIYISFLPVVAVMNCFNNFLVCNGYATKTFIVGVLYNVFNVVLCYIVIYTSIVSDANKLDAISLMSGIAMVGGALLAIGFFVYKKCDFRFVCKKEQMKRIIRIGVPGGINGFSFRFSQTVTTAFIALLGVAAFNTKVYISNIISFSSIVSLGIAQAGAIFSGRFRGRGEFENIEKMYRMNIVMGIAFNVLVAVSVYIFCNSLMRIFTDDIDAIRLAKTVVLIDIGVELFRAFNQVSDNTLNANGDVKIIFIVSTISCWLFSVLCSYLLGIRMEMGLIGVWIAFLMDEIFKTVIYFFRWNSKKWRYTKI